MGRIEVIKDHESKVNICSRKLDGFVASAKSAERSPRGTSYQIFPHTKKRPGCGINLSTLSMRLVYKI